MNNIFVLNGLPLSGKTTFGEIVGQELLKHHIAFIHASSINPIKSILRPFDSWDKSLLPHAKVLRELKRKVTKIDWDGATKDEFWRKAMSDLKLKVTEYNPDLIHSLVVSHFMDMQEPWVAFVDIREPENIRSFIMYCHGHLKDVRTATVLVESVRAVRAANKSDESVYETKYDFTIHNNGTIELLRETSQTFIEEAILNNGHQRERRS